MAMLGYCWPKGCRFSSLGDSSGIGWSNGLSPPPARTCCPKESEPELFKSHWILMEEMTSH